MEQIVFGLALLAGGWLVLRLRQPARDLTAQDNRTAPGIDVPYGQGVGHQPSDYGWTAFLMLPLGAIFLVFGVAELYGRG